MKTPIPKPNPDINSLTRAVHQLCDRVRELEIMDSPSIKVSNPGGGTIIEIKKTTDSVGAETRQVWL